jgi:23S rRNA (pseudouridine1915-N3)-methyltransferase
VQLRVIWFGRPAASPYEQQVGEYRARVARRWPAEDLPLRSAAGGRGSDARRALRREAEAARAVVPPGWRLGVLDESGRAYTSEGLAAELQRLQDGGARGLALIIGSDLGLHPELVAGAVVRLSLSPMTLPHLLARLVLWEQLYRATQILGGGRYHRSGLQ